MSYSTSKGGDGERECSEFLNEVFKEFGFKFFRVGGAERWKRTLAGDVVLDAKTDPNGLCVLKPYYIEVKKRENLQVFNSLAKAEDDAEHWGKFGAIGYFIKQGRGHQGERIIAMGLKTFERLMSELQRSRGKGV